MSNSSPTLLDATEISRNQKILHLPTTNWQLAKLDQEQEQDLPFGPTLASEHLASEDRLEVYPETLQRWMLADER